METSIKQAANQLHEIEVIECLPEPGSQGSLITTTNHVNETLWSKRLKDACKQLQRKTAILLRRKLHMRMFPAMSACGYIENRIIGVCQVERMPMLRERFCSYMQEKHPDFFYNPEYTTQKLKRKTSDQFGTKIQVFIENCFTVLSPNVLPFFFFFHRPS